MFMDITNNHRGRRMFSMLQTQKRLSHINKSYESSFKINVITFINSQYQFNTSKSTAREANNLHDTGIHVKHTHCKSCQLSRIW